jgi:integrase
MTELPNMAASNLLSDKAIRSAVKRATEEGKARKISDGGGLVLDVRPTGAGWWRLRYWRDGREGMLSLGTYPTVSLADARGRRDEARKQIAAGADPSVQRKEEKRARAARLVVERAISDGEAMPGSFAAVAWEWLVTVHQEKVSDGHAERTRVRFENDIFPWLGSRPISKIEAPELLAALRKIEARGAIETAHRAKDACGQVFRFGIAAGYCTRNPAADLREALQPVPTRHHAAIVEPKRAGRLLRDMLEYQGHPVTRAALALSAMLMLRPGELRQLEWAWIDFETPTLTIPANMMKRTKAEKASGVPHVVPLAPQALAILRDDLQPLTGAGRYVFPGLHSAERPMSENTVRSALRRLGYGNEDMTAHGFRAMARTMAAERLGIAPEVIEAQLAHTVPDALGRAYNRTQYLDQRRELMMKWADYLDRLRKGAEVIPLPQRAA